MRTEPPFELVPAPEEDRAHIYARLRSGETVLALLCEEFDPVEGADIWHAYRYGTGELLAVDHDLHACVRRAWARVRPHEEEAAMPRKVSYDAVPVPAGQPPGLPEIGDWIEKRVQWLSSEANVLQSEADHLALRRESVAEELTKLCAMLEAVGVDISEVVA